MDDFGRVKAALNIADVVSRHVKLKAAGARLKGLCPFHAEKTPSFTVNVKDQYFKCFGCGKGGDVFVFHQEMERVELVEALHQLAEMAGITLEKPRGGKDSREGDRLPRILELAQRYFQAELRAPIGAAARQWLHGRGLSVETQQEFGIGFAPRGSDQLLQHLRRAGFQDAELEEVGIARDRNGSLRAAFFDRIMIPIRSDRGRVIAYGARRLVDGEGAPEPKYINSKETPLFHKSSVLFGLDIARDAMVESECAVLMEGYMDVIAARQAGVINAVAILGTAVTEDHTRLLHRFVKRIVMLLDGDEAGRRATVRSLPLLLGAGLSTRVVRLPEGMDPGDFFEAGKGRAEFEGLVADSSMEGLDFLLREHGAQDARSHAEKARVASAMAEVLAYFADPIGRASAAQHLSKELGIPADALESSIRSKAGRNPRHVPQRESAPKEPVRTPSPGSGERRSAQSIAEEELLAALLLRPGLRRIAPQVVPGGSIRHPILARHYQLLTENASADVAFLMQMTAGDRSQQEPLLDILERYRDDDPESKVDPDRLFDGAVRFFERNRAQQQGVDLIEQYRTALEDGDPASTLRFLAEYRTLRRGAP